MNVTNFPIDRNVSVLENSAPPLAASAASLGRGFQAPQTRSSNTGLQCQTDSDITLGIDYLTFVLPIPDAGFVFDRLESIAVLYTDAFEYHWSQGRFLGRQFANWASSPYGLMATWNLPGENCDRGSLRVSIGGSSLIRSDMPQTLRLITDVLLWGGKVNRIDFKADDYSRKMLPSDVRDAIHNKNYSGFKKGHIQEDLDGDIYDRGWTIYLGSRESDKMARYYNAKPVHGIDAFRFEVEFKNDSANEIAKAISLMIAKANAKYNSYDNARKEVDDWLIEWIPKFILSNYKFIDRSGPPGPGNIRASRSPILPFWEDFVSRMGGSGVRLPQPKIVSCIQKSIAWVERSVASTLAMISQYVGGDRIAYLKHLIKLGDEKMGSRHQTILKVSRREPVREYPIEDGYVYYASC
jgi:hypothetical protein